ncbi:peptidase M48-like protein [Tenacibaculum adriaticum]|uniref:Peptidase M48-like protein n=1 Tax=Tenacibaculum adriaticum TaxID=413713 RepID=A0A5S5DNN9_9FLAO|nr:M48 family metallopeptidase [Tenacibaculum adriaticum]TYP97563.1 peptidase M48-like protein [Tenacibaculum adriaticum]
MSFKANYFDGESSKTYLASVHPNTTDWRILFTDENGLHKEVHWKIEDIQKSEVFTKGLIAFTYGKTFPFQKIESSDNTFIEYISKSIHKNLNNKIDILLHKSGNKSITLLLLAIVGFAAGMYFYVIPTVAINFAKNLPKERVITFGNYVYRALSPDWEIDYQQSKKLQYFVDAMQIDSEFPIKAHVVKNDDLNAFAISGGKVIIYSSLLKKIENENQLAALISHEISHINNRHVLKNVSRNLSSAIFVSVLFGDINSITAIIGENAHLFSQLSFTRSLEKEADIFGLEMMRKNNLDLHGMPELFQLLKKETSRDIPSFLDSHPMLKDRIEYTKKIADKQESFEQNEILKEKWLDLKNSFSSEEKTKSYDDLLNENY